MNIQLIFGFYINRTKLVNRSVHSGHSDSAPHMGPNTIKPTKQFMDVVVPGKGVSISPKQPSRSKTLMRSAVNKPEVKPSSKLKAVSPIKTDGIKAVSPKTSVLGIDNSRQKRANYIEKSDLVSRFSTNSEYSSTLDELNVAEAENLPAEEKHQPKVIEPLPQKQFVQPSQELFEKHLNSATAQHQPPLVPYKKHRKHSRKLVGALTGGLAVIAVGTFLAYHNFARIDLYLAASKAGFSATTPSYNPSGYDLASVSSGNGIIQASYHSNSDSRQYTISEKRTNWDSNTLLDTYVINKAGQNYETVQSAGRTIYIYGNRNATWVNGGIWYIITSNNSLSDQQLISLATSM